MSLQDGGLQVSLTSCWVIQLKVTEPLFWAMLCAGKALGALSASALQGLTAQYLLTAGMGTLVTRGEQAGPMLCPRQDGSVVISAGGGGWGERLEKALPENTDRELDLEGYIKFLG